jgi:hypothetical protein
MVTFLAGRIVSELTGICFFLFRSSSFGSTGSENAGQATAAS